MQYSFYKKIFCLLLLIGGTKLFAQQAKLDLPEFKSNTVISCQKPTLNFLTRNYSVIKIENSFSEVHSSVKRPLFCRMEDNLHKRFNVWIVLRAGSDDEYRKLIAPKK